MNIKKLFVGMAALALAMTFGVSCSMPGMDDLANNGRDVEARLEFVGGSLAVGDGLVPGSRALVRLGAVEVVEAGYVDKAEEARFGLLTVNAVDAQAISFDFARFDAKGDYEATVTHSLSLGEGADLNGDGVPDVAFAWQGNGAALVFVSSPEQLATTMFTTISGLSNAEEMLLGVKVAGAEESGILAFGAVDISSPMERRVTRKEAVIICCFFIGMSLLLVYGACVGGIF